MRLSIPSLLCLLILGLAVPPAVSHADYQPADVALNKLENIVTLSPAQREQALQIFQNLKDIMDDMAPADRPEKGAEYRQAAIAAIRGILTPEQQAVYDRTSQRLGGGSTSADPAMSALNAKIRIFVTNFARRSPEIAAQVGPVQKVNLGRSSTSGFAEDSDDPALHPSGGTNVVRVTGASGTQRYKITWTMSESGKMTVTAIQNLP